MKFMIKVPFFVSLLSFSWCFRFIADDCGLSLVDGLIAFAESGLFCKLGIRLYSIY